MLPFKYILKRSTRRSRSTSIRVSDEGVIVSAPRWVSVEEIEHFLTAKKDWIITHLQKIPRVSNKKTYHDGETHLYFGESFPLKITTSQTIAKPKLSLLYDRFEALIPIHFSDSKRQLELKHLFTKWYLKQGKKVIAQKVEHFAKTLNVTYNRITLKRVSSIWGSCSRKNNLNFNRKLLMAPHKIVDYVVIHEVAHLVHRHHRKSFWDLVQKLDPDYRTHVRWLKDNSHILTL